MKIGILEGQICIIRKMLSKSMSINGIADLLEMDEAYVDKIRLFIKENPNQSNRDIASAILESNLT